MVVESVDVVPVVMPVDLVELLMVGLCWTFVILIFQFNCCVKFDY